MRSKIWKLLTIIFAVALIAPAFSAVESVKVGGDITIYGVWRDNYPYFKSSEGTSYKSYNFFQTTVRVYVTADLTDNIQAMVRLINERAWGISDSFNDTSQITLDLGYIKVTDILTPGLTLTVGRQEIQFGEGLVVGSQYNAAFYQHPANPLPAPDLGYEKAFDAIRADYELAGYPVVLTGFMSKISETVLSSSTSDTNLYGLNIAYQPDNFTLETYYVRNDVLHTDANLSIAGIRGVAEVPAIEGLKIGGEFAKQFGENASGNDYKGWAGLFNASYAFPVNMEPVVKVGYYFFKGDESGGDIKGWVPVYPSNIASRVGKLAYPALFPAGAGALYAGGSQVSSNPWYGLQVITLGLTFKPVEKISVGLDWFNLKLDEDYNNQDKLGNEIDLSITYAYTEDLTFGLDVGYFITDDVLEKNSDWGTATDADNAWQVIASMKVAF